MPLSDPLLWDKIATWTLPHRRERDDEAEPPRTCASFEDCLRKRGDWTDASARRITEAYRRFLYLKALSGETIAPSKAIDIAWNLHRGFPDDYKALCAALDREVPRLTYLGKAEMTRAYERGRTLFESEFDRPPDRDLWPSGEDRIRYYLWRALALVAAALVVLIALSEAKDVGGFRGVLLGAAIIVPSLFVALYVVLRVGDVTPPRMTRDKGLYM
jgi:hypothetical protein